MSDNNYTITIRPKRQTTLPGGVLDSLGIGVGDSLNLKVDDGQVILTPKKKIALDALDEIKSAFEKSGVKEDDLQSELEKNREQGK